MFPLKFTSKIYRRDLTPQEVRDDQQKLKTLINKLNGDYNRTGKIKIKKKKVYLKVCKQIAPY